MKNDHLPARRAATILAAISAVAGVAAGCGNDPEPAPSAAPVVSTTGHTSKSPHASSTPPRTPHPTSAAPKLAGSSPVPLPPPSPSHPAASETVTPTPRAATDDVHCGPVDDPEGAQAGYVIAVGTPEGRPGCVEAIDVVTEYITERHDTESHDTGPTDVDGWSCRTTDDAVVPVKCGRDSLQIAMRSSDT